MSESRPVALIVNVEIKPDFMDAFLSAIEADAIGSRTEEGCLRFDVLRDQSNPHRFVFYEVYKSDEAIAAHKETPHFQLWTDFRASGGVESLSFTKCDATFFG